MLSRSIALMMIGACATDPVAPSPQPYQPQPYVAPPQPVQTAAVANGDPYASARQTCLDQTNAYRARVKAGPLTAQPDKYRCSDEDARGDAKNGTIHGESGKCGLMAQNECPSWPGTAAGIVSECLKSMFDEGPGEPYSAHGHFINMTNPKYRSLACGFYEQGGKVWLVQNYFF